MTVHIYDSKNKVVGAALARASYGSRAPAWRRTYIICFLALFITAAFRAVLYLPPRKFTSTLGNISCLALLRWVDHLPVLLDELIDEGNAPGALASESLTGGVKCQWMLATCFALLQQEF
jgi:hypothetical protein